MRRATTTKSASGVSIARAIGCLGIIGLLGAALLREARAITYQTLDYPGATNTRLYSISAGKVFGWTPKQDFTYDGSVFTPLDVSYPGKGLAGYGVRLNAMSGDKLVGRWTNNYFDTYFGCVFVGGSFLSYLQFPGSYWTDAHGTSGNSVVGTYLTSAYGPEHGFLWNNGVYTALDFPGAYATIPMDVSGNVVVGYYFRQDGYADGFVWDGAAYSGLNIPGATSSSAYGICEGGQIVGSYFDGSGGHGFFYDGSQYTAIDGPLGTGTSVWGVDGNTVVGDYYSDASHSYHGFIATIPEPSSFALLALASLTILAYRASCAAHSSWRRRR
jgi:hypothetical protein